jgi:hypothetical protein
MARPRVKIDVAELEKLYGMQCTDEEVAAFVGVSTRTLARRKGVQKFADVIERAKARGRVSVRRALFRLAAAGNIAAAIFLAKNLLGYKDIVSNEHSGPDGTPIQFANKPDYSQLSDEELEQLRNIAKNHRAPRGGHPRPDSQSPDQRPASAHEEPACLGVLAGLGVDSVARTPVAI